MHYHFKKRFSKEIQSSPIDSGPNINELLQQLLQRCDQRRYLKALTSNAGSRMLKLDECTRNSMIQMCVHIHIHLIRKKYEYENRKGPNFFYQLLIVRPVGVGMTRCRFHFCLDVHPFGPSVSNTLNKFNQFNATTEFIRVWHIASFC